MRQVAVFAAESLLFSQLAGCVLLVSAVHVFVWLFCASCYLRLVVGLSFVACVLSVSWLVCLLVAPWLFLLAACCSLLFAVLCVIVVFRMFVVCC